MSRKIIQQSPGEAIAEPVKQFLLTQFESGEVDRIETLGGVIEILLSTTPRGLKRRKDFQVCPEYLTELGSLSTRSDALNQELQRLTTTQLRTVCEMLLLPAPKSLRKRDLILNVKNHLKSSDAWQTIIGTADASRK